MVRATEDTMNSRTSFGRYVLVTFLSLMVLAATGAVAIETLFWLMR